MIASPVPGELAEFARLFDRYYPALHRYLRRRVGDGLADDLAAETFLQAFRGRDRYGRADAEAAPWLYGIAGNLVRQHARAERRRLRALARLAPERAEDVDDAVAERVDAAVLAHRLAMAVADLSADQREVLLLYAWTDLDYPGIAAAIGVPPGTMRSRLHRARRHLRRELERTHGDDRAAAQTDPREDRP